MHVNNIGQVIYTAEEYYLVQGFNELHDGIKGNNWDISELMIEYEFIQEVLGWYKDNGIVGLQQER